MKLLTSADVDVVAVARLDLDLVAAGVVVQLAQVKDVAECGIFDLQQSSNFNF